MLGQLANSQQQFARFWGQRLGGLAHREFTRPNQRLHLAPAPSQPQGLAPGDAEEPDAEMGWTAQLAEAPVGLDEGVLRGILGGVVIAQDLPRRRPRGALVAAQQLR